MAYRKRPAPTMRHRHKPPPRITRMNRGYGYLCPRCRDVIMYDRVDEVYFCWKKQACGFTESKADYAETLADIRTTLDRAKTLTEMARWKVMAERREDLLNKTGVVYYLQFGDRIKIGTTQDPAERFKAHPWDQVLALEPGTYEREHYRHLQFKHLLVRERHEWFNVSDELLAHTDDLRKRHANWVRICFDGAPMLPWDTTVPIPEFAVPVLG